MKTSTTYPMGSVSRGTMREEDLIPTFLSVLESLDKEVYVEICSAHEDELAILDKDSDQWTDDEIESLSCFLNETLFDALNNYAAPYFYFGSHLGDGCDYGFWFNAEAFDQAVEDGEILKCDELPEDRSGDFAYYAVISDHGNISLYTQ